ncbi:MAG: N-methyl-L-tryptophan oxidase [Planctomycetes bacterium]|nr:N-methyl-L-tryptophan oxidase [Planctomycetota bacterium]
MPHYDAVVLGCGGVGSAALYHLARRGMRVLGIDRFPPAHDRGSSHGSTRIIRQAYFEHPDYVPLLLTAYELWQQLEQEWGRRLFWQTGLLQVGPSDGEVLPGVLASARQHELAVESLTAEEAMARFPGFRIPQQLAAVFEPKAGSLAVEECVRAHLAGAVAAGAELRCGAAVERWDVGSAAGNAGLVRVRVGNETLSAARLIVTAGPWAASLLTDLGVELAIERRVQHWYASSPAYAATAGFPAYLFELPDGIFYGFPSFDARGVKVAEHTGADPVADPLALERKLRASDSPRVEGFLQAYLPGVSTDRTAFDVCMYTMSPDQHFIVDRYPGQPQVVFAAGLSGHGYKFSGVLGRALADLAMDGGTTLPIDFLSLRRLGQGI